MLAVVESSPLADRLLPVGAGLPGPPLAPGAVHTLPAARHELLRLPRQVAALQTLAVALDWSAEAPHPTPLAGGAAAAPLQ